MVVIIFIRVKKMAIIWKGEKFLTVAEISRKYKVPMQTIYYWIHKGWVKAFVFKRRGRASRGIFAIHEKEAERVFGERGMFRYEAEPLGEEWEIDE